MRTIIHPIYNIRSLLVLLASVFALTGCDVHEFPDIPGKVPFTLHLDCTTELPIYQEINYTTRSGKQATEHDIRYIINIYRSDDGENFTRQADTTIVYTRHLDEEKDHSIQLNLNQGFYNFIVWSDHVDKGTSGDKYYNTSNFAEIAYPDRENYEGNNDFQDAFRGTVQAVVLYNQYSDGSIVAQEASVQLERPLAKFKFISTDLEEFVGQVLENAASKGKTASRTINPDDYRVVFRYTGFMPCSFNMFTNKPNDSWTGVSFDGKMIPLDEHEIELGFDYVFVNGAESKTNVAVEVYDKDGELLSSTNTVEVTLVRSKLTIVRGNFITSKATGSVGINPDYNGDFNIEIK